MSPKSPGENETKKPSTAKEERMKRLAEKIGLTKSLREAATEAEIGYSTARRYVKEWKEAGLLSMVDVDMVLMKVFNQNEFLTRIAFKNALKASQDPRMSLDKVAYLSSIYRYQSNELLKLLKMTGRLSTPKESGEGGSGGKMIVEFVSTEMEDLEKMPERPIEYKDETVSLPNDEEKE